LKEKHRHGCWSYQALAFSTLQRDVWAGKESENAITKRDNQRGDENHPLTVGSNYIREDAINEPEIWQAATFDAAQVDKELGWAEDVGMNTGACLPA
jgi:hypothetical protein